jgi:hypothetical protein
LSAFVAHRATQGMSARTRANELSHLRAALVQVGKQGLARNPAYSNRALGVERGSRIGTKQPLSDAAIRAFQGRMDRLARPGIGADQSDPSCTENPPSEAQTGSRRRA